MKASEQFAKFIYELKFDSIPDTLKKLLKLEIMDTLGNIYAGSVDPVVPKLMAVLEDGDSSKSCSVLSWAKKMSVENAAMLNASMAFSLDYDDMHEPARLHAGCVILPTVLAVSEKIGNITGEQALEAMAASLEVCSRLGKYMIRRNPTQVMGGWDYAALMGYLSSSIVSAKLLGLSPDGIMNAMGIAFHQMAGTSISAQENANTKVIGPGLAARGGILAARLASVGVTGAHNIFDETEISMAKQYHNGCESDKLVQNLGTVWVAEELGFKAYPCCRLVHRHIDAALAAVKKNDIKPEEVEAINISSCAMIAPMCEPTEKNVAPPAKVASQFSVPWTVACAIVKRKVAIAEFEPDELNDAEIQNMARKINYKLDPELKDLDAPANVTIVTKRGEFTEKTGIPYGAAENPIDEKDLKTKFIDCASFGKVKRSADELEKILDAIMSIERYDRLVDFIDLVK